LKVLYIFPHPDDESFGPGLAMAAQRRQGHDVHLLTLTRGGATKLRHKLGYTVEEMGRVRAQEMHRMAEVLSLSGMTILDLPDGGLKEMIPWEIEKVVESEIALVRPEVVVTYAVHGISGFHDHLVGHAAVKRVFCKMQESDGAPSRLALFTLSEVAAARSTHFHLNGSRDEDIDCIVRVDEQDRDKCMRALDCYETYLETIDRSGIRDLIGYEVFYEFFREDYTPPASDLFVDL